MGKESGVNIPREDMSFTDKIVDGGSRLTKGTNKFTKLFNGGLIIAGAATGGGLLLAGAAGMAGDIMTDRLADSAAASREQKYAERKAAEAVEQQKKLPQSERLRQTEVLSQLVRTENAKDQAPQHNWQRPMGKWRVQTPLYS